MGKYKYSKGVSLIEVLVAVIVLAFGLLGLAGLQSVSLRNNNSAMMRTQATYLAQDIVDRMRSNRLEAVGNVDTNNENYDIAIGSTTPAGGANALTQADLTSWKTTLLASLPAGDGAIDCASLFDPGTGPGTGVCTVTIQWDDSRGAQAAQQFVTSTQL